MITGALNFTLGQPAPLLLARLLVKAFGGVKAQERFGVLYRPAYAYGLTRAAEYASRLGIKTVSVCEFGVARGDGLLNLCKLARKISRVHGVRFHIHGFDTGSGLPKFSGGYKEHPECWHQGEFAMGDVDSLRKRLGGDADLHIGDISDTAPRFAKQWLRDEPLGFAVIDTDCWSGSIAALLGAMREPADRYLPAVPLYFDDVVGFSINRRCGELASIEEFNLSLNRFIDRDRSLICRPSKVERWYQHAYVLHVLDHPARQPKVIL